MIMRHARYRDFFIRPAFGDQDSAIIREVMDFDCYGLRTLCVAPAPRRVIDIGAHIGSFARLVHDLYPDAEVTCVEPVPENFELLRLNVPRAHSVLGACSYVPGELQLFTTLHAGGRSTGGSFVAPAGFDGYRAWQNAEEYLPSAHLVHKVTLEEIVADRGWTGIDMLKLDCEGKLLGGEWSILNNTTLLDRIGVIVGEYHGESRQNDEHGDVKFQRLVAARFGGWTPVDSGGEIGRFCLVNPRYRAAERE